MNLNRNGLIESPGRGWFQAITKNERPEFKVAATLRSQYVVDALSGALIGLVHSPLVRNIMENLMTIFISSKLMPLFSAGV